jgi:poly(beta-D-mannuronate) C5 epimerase
MTIRSSCILSLFITAIVFSTFSTNQNNLNAEEFSKRANCIEYDSEQRLINVRCKRVQLTDIYNKVGNSSILAKENTADDKVDIRHSNVWILRAGIVVEKEGGLIIDSNDTSWLKIVPTHAIQKIQQSNQTNNMYPLDAKAGILRVVDDSGYERNFSDNNRISPIVVSKNNGDNPNGIHVHGSLKIYDVKITSWDPERNDVIAFDFGKRPGEEHTKSDYDTAEPRAFIRISKDATGTTDITNSEIAHLGYSCSRCSGLSYYGGEGSVIKNNNIHHLLKGYYSKGMGYTVIENNEFHDNYLYGIDPHTGSHDMIIRNNKVYDNNASGIICSKHCYNLLIEGNEVYRNAGVGRGIAFSINTTNSIARNNDVHNNERCISFNRESNFNQVYNNTISNCKVGIYLSNTSNNSIFDNDIIDSSSGIVIKHDITNNITNNLIEKTDNGITYISKNNGGTIASIKPDDDIRNINLYLDGLESANKLDMRNPVLIEKNKIKSLTEMIDR